MASGETSDYTQLIEAISSEAERVGQPLDGAFEITSRCNLSCRMCYVHDCLDSKVPAPTELSAQDWVSLAEHAADAGMLFLLLTGGEPFIRKDFFSIYEPMTELGLYLILFTNGTLITPEIARRLAQRPPWRLEISLYGASPDTYEKITGSADAFERCCAGIEALKSAGFTNMLLKSPLSRHNLADLPAMRKMAKDWDLLFTPSWMLTQKRNEKSSEVDAFRLSPDVVAALKAEDEGITALPREDPSHERPEGSPQKPLYCGAGQTSFVIDSQGVMMPCMDMPSLRTYPLQTGFGPAWEKLKELTAAIPLSSTCNDQACAVYRDCPWCPGTASLETGSLTEPVPYMCEIARECADMKKASG